MKELEEKVNVVVKGGALLSSSILKYIHELLILSSDFCMSFGSIEFCGSV